MDIEGATHADAGADQLRMAQREVDSMIAAEAAPGDPEARRGILRAYERDDLIDQVILVLDMAQHAIARRDAPVVPALFVHAVHAEGLQAAGIVLITDGAD